MRRAHARELGGILQCLHQRNRRPLRESLALGDGADEGVGDALRVEPDAAATRGEIGNGRKRRAVRLHRRACRRKVRRDGRRHLVPIDEDRRLVERDERKGEPDGVAGHVGAADVEEPADVVKRGHDERVGALGLQRHTHAFKLRLGRLTRVLERVHAQRLARRRRPGSAPDGVDGIGLEAVDAEAGLGRGIADVGRERGARDGGVDAYHGARGEAGILEPLGRRGDAFLASFLERPLVGKFLLRLQPVAPIRPEQRRTLRDHRRPRRTREPAHERAPLVASRDVFGEVRVVGGDDEGGKAARLELLAQRGERRRALPAVVGAAARAQLHLRRPRSPAQRGLRRAQSSDERALREEHAAAVA
mmetsp:Transcript_31734/g.106927  ORF Transcript_31734/g.106927 Transcript_31734/m.106927 type:complete len:362 (-) Transcript_31734:3-1088(-)